MPTAHLGERRLLRPEPGVFDLLPPGGDLVADACERLAGEGRLFGYQHGFWKPADTFKERAELDAAYRKGIRRGWCGSSRNRASQRVMISLHTGRSARSRCSARTATTSRSGWAAPCSQLAASTSRACGCARWCCPAPTHRREIEERAALAAFCPGADLELHVLDVPDGRAPAHWEPDQERARGLSRATANPTWCSRRIEATRIRTTGCWPSWCRPSSATT